MRDARRGYSTALLQIVEQRDQSDVVARYAKHCIRTGVSATAVSDIFGVSRSMVYYWFKGDSRPRERHVSRMLEILRAAGVE